MVTTSRLSPFVRQELQNLDKDADTRKNAIRVLKSCVKTLDSNSIPVFTAGVSMTNDPGSFSGDYTISLFEVLARNHGRKIVPQIDNMMSTIIQTLLKSAGSLPLHQACAQVVPAISRYGIEPSMTQDEKIGIISSLCNPLSGSLIGSSENLASGAALCLTALVESDNWRFASNHTINQLCLKLAGALQEKPTQTNAHMGLVMALAKHNSFIVDGYARSLLRSGLEILAVGIADGNSQKRFSAIQMINFLMKCVDYRNICTELPNVAEAMVNCQADPMLFVKGAAFEALQTSKMLGVAQKGSSWITSPESQTIDSFFRDEASSPLSTQNGSSSFDKIRCTNRRLWNHNSEGCVDVSLKDGLFSASVSSSNSVQQLNSNGSLVSSNGSESSEEESENFSGFNESELIQPSTPSSPKQNSHIFIDDVKIYSTPSRLIRSLQNSSDSSCSCNCTSVENSNYHATKTPTYVHQVKREIEMSEDQYCYSNNMKCCEGGMASAKVVDMMVVSGKSESDSSNGDAEVVRSEKNEVQAINVARIRMGRRFYALSLVCCIALIIPIVAAVLLFMWNNGEENLYDSDVVVPT